MEVGEESRQRVGEGERWRRRVIRIIIRGAGAFKKWGEGEEAEYVVAQRPETQQ